MPQTGYTPIQLFRTATAAAVPVNTALVAGELAINYDDADMALFAKNESNTVKRIMNNPAGLKYPTADGTVGQPVTTDGAGNLAFGGTGALQLPVGTTAQQPTGASGLIRMNSSTGRPEWYSTAYSMWIPFSTAMSMPNVGDPIGGGFFAGFVSVSGNGIASHYLIVSPKATGETVTALPWDSTAGGSTTGLTSVIAGPTNSAALAAGGARYAAATFCENLTINGYSDWYLPAKNELEVAYYFLKNVSQANFYPGTYGANANAVPPMEPVSTAYSAIVPAQTTAAAFRVGAAEAFADYLFWSSTEFSTTAAWIQYFFAGNPGIQDSNTSKAVTYHVRAFRRLAL